MRFRLAALSTAALAALAGLVAVAQPPAETRAGNKSGYQPAFAGQTRAPALTTDTKFDVKEVTKPGDFQTPWAVEFLPGGKFIVTERTAGQFRIIDKDGKVSPPIKDGVPAVMSRGQGGLLDVALDPNFATNQTIYWSYLRTAG
ncbi:MAG: PQQ-dependent sugar dehydrogenase [Hyphomonadaceae bacterium]